MEDRYLFKAKRIDNGKWEIGSLIILPNGEWEIGNRCNNQPDSDPMWRRCVITHKVEPSTICQCTGLKDRNGKLIWENDIIKDNVIYGVVRWEGVNARYIIDDRDDGYQDYSEWWQECEVIGNIFDNKELFESEEI